jgi:hypothetical protein
MWHHGKIQQGGTFVWFLVAILTAGLTGAQALFPRILVQPDVI